MSYPNHPNNPKGVTCPYDIAELMTPENIARYRASFGIESQDDLARLVDFYNRIIDVHNEALEREPYIEALEELLAGTESALSLITEIIHPTAQDLFESEADLVEPEIPA